MPKQGRECAHVRMGQRCTPPTAGQLLKSGERVRKGEPPSGNQEAGRLGCGKSRECEYLVGDEGLYPLQTVPEGGLNALVLVPGKNLSRHSVCLLN